MAYAVEEIASLAKTGRATFLEIRWCALVGGRDGLADEDPLDDRHTRPLTRS